MVSSARSTASRLAFFYATHFAVIGVLLPFWPVWLKGRGLSVGEIGVVLALGGVMKVFSNPLAASIADRRGDSRSVIIALAVMALAGFALFGVAWDFWSILLAALLFFAIWPAMMPLAESLTMLTARERGLDYGRIRLWGSIAFIATSAATGQILGAYPPDAIFWVALALVALKAVTCAALPRTPSPRAPGGGLLVLDVLADRRFVVCLLAAALIQSSHAVYYGFGSLHWLKSGLDETTIGWLWAEGVLAEIVLFLFGQRLLARFGPFGLLALGGLAGVVRWPVLALGGGVAALAAAQVLHAFTYGAAHLGAIHFISRAVPPHLSATAQGLYAAFVMGIAFSIGLLSAGALYEAFGGGAFWVMAAMSACGTGLTAAAARMAPKAR